MNQELKKYTCPCCGYKTLNDLIKILDPSSEIDRNAINFSQDEWFTTYLKN